MKEYLSKIYNMVIHFIKYNVQFTSFIILSILCSIFVRIYTSGNLAFNPLVFDICMPILFGAFCYLFRPKKQFGYLFICLIVLSLVCIINSIYYSFYSSYASFSLLSSLGQASEVTDAIFEKLRLIQFIYLLAPVLFIIINRKLSRRDYFEFITKIEDGKKTFKYVLGIGASIFAFGCAIMNGGAWSSLTKQWNREYAVNHFGIVVYQINDFINTLKPTINSWVGYDVAYKKFTDYYENNTIKKSDNEYTNKFLDYNVVFVHMESIMTFLLDLNINNVEITPNLNKLAKEGIYFNNFYPQISAGTSSDTEFTLSTSLMPSASGTVFVSYFDREYESIQKLLKNRGYYTFSMHGNKASMWNRNKMHPNLGYMDFYSQTSFDLDELIGLGLSDKSFFRQAIPILETIEENNKKYMGTVITLTNHTPFDNNNLFEQINLRYKGKVFDEKLNKYVDVDYDYLENTKLGDYIRSSHYADEALGEFIKYINESNYFNKTIFVFYGDHDPKLALNEFYNYYNYDFKTGKIKTIDDEDYIPYDYYDNELNKKTPLIIWSKNEKFNSLVDYKMGMIDVMPTLGNMFGVYNKYALGKDIFEVKNNNIVSFPNGNFLTSKVYYRNSKEEYKPLTMDEVLSEDYISYIREYTDNLIEVSNGIITHDLIKSSKNKDEVKEIK